MVVADRPGASLPSKAASAGAKSPVDTPQIEDRDQRIEALRTPGVGRQDCRHEADARRIVGARLPVAQAMTVMIWRSGRCPCRTTRGQPSSLFRSAVAARNSNISASTTWEKRRRADRARPEKQNPPRRVILNSKAGFAVVAALRLQDQGPDPKASRSCLDPSAFRIVGGVMRKW